MKINNIEELFKYIIDSCTTETKLYVSGLLSDGAIFKDVPVILNGNENLPTDLEEPDYVKRIKKLEVISKKSFLERTKYILTHLDDKQALIDIKALRKKDLVLDYNPLKIWLDFSKKILNVGVETVNGNIPFVLAVCDELDEYFFEYDINGIYDPFITEIKNEEGKILFENKYNNNLLELKNSFRIKKISYIIENFIYYYREEYVGEVRKEDAIKFAVELIMSAEFLAATEYSAFKPYIVENESGTEEGYLIDYIGPYSDLEENAWKALNVKVDGQCILNPVDESEIIENKFKKYTDPYSIIEDAQKYVFSALNIDDKSNKVLMI